MGLKWIRTVICIACMLFTMQIVYGLNFALGIKGGLNIGFYAGSEYENWNNYWENLMYSASGGVSFDVKMSPMLGLTIGGFAMIGINDIIALQPEVSFTIGGGSSYYKEAGMFVGGEMYETRYMVEMPVIIKLRFTVSHGTIVYIYGGPEIALVIGRVDGEWMESGQTDATMKWYWDDESTIKMLYNIVAGIGMDYSLGIQTYLSIDARLEYGLSQVIKSTDWFEHNIQLSFGIGWLM